MNSSHPTAALRPRGFSMIEMLIGVLIISFGLLGLITLQSRALQVSVSSEDSQRAALLAGEIAAQMLNNNSVTLTAADKAAWAQRVADPTGAGLPNGVGTVVATATNTVRVTVAWTPPQAASGAANETHTYVTDVVIP